MDEKPPTISEFLNQYGVTVERREAEGDALAETLRLALLDPKPLRQAILDLGLVCTRATRGEPHKSCGASATHLLNWRCHCWDDDREGDALCRTHALEANRLLSNGGTLECGRCGSHATGAKPLSKAVR